MTRTSPWPVVVVGLAVALIAFVGCNGRKSSPPEAAIPKPSAEAADGSLLFKNWPTPAGALVITGEMIGYLEPCGCTLGQLGGLGRRYDLVEGMRAKGWPLALIDLGSLADPPGFRGGIKESEIKFTVALQALKDLKYDAIAFSAGDLRPSVAETMGQYLNLGDRPVVVAANVAPTAGFESTVRPSARASAGDIRLGITAVLDPDALKALNDPDKDTLLAVTPPREALPKVLADLEADTHVQVLMVQGPPALAKELAGAFPGFDVVVATSDEAEPADQPEMLNGGQTFLVQVGKKGKFVGVVGLFKDPKQKLRYQRVNLNQKYKNAEPMRKLINEDFQGLMKGQQVVETYPKHEYIGAQGATFLGASACKSCHPNTYAKWASTKHAQAYEALADPKRNRIHDAECISCHTTGFEYKTGFVSAEQTPNLKGNQCENCHGPGSKHAAEPDNVEFRIPMKLTAERADKQGLCLRCHDEDNDPKFDFAPRWGNIVHKGLDTYADPKVHQGVAPVEASRP